jgi:phosphatidylinositol 4-kinase
LNEIARYSDEDTTGKLSSIVLFNNGVPVFEMLSESQKQQVCVNALSAIVGVAVYLKDETVRTFFHKQLCVSKTKSLVI